MKLLLATALLTASIASAHAAPTVAETTTDSSVKPFLASTTIDGETHTYNLALPRDQRTVDLRITKKDRKGETLVASSTLSTLVASKKFNDHPKLLGVPIQVSRTSKYLVDARDTKGNEIAVAPMAEGMSAVVYLSDSTPQLGTASVHLKFADVKNLVDESVVFDQTITMNLDEGVNTKKMGPYTLTVTIGPAQTTSLAVFR